MIFIKIFDIIFIENERGDIMIEYIFYYWFSDSETPEMFQEYQGDIDDYTKDGRKIVDWTYISISI